MPCLRQWGGGVHGGGVQWWCSSDVAIVRGGVLDDDERL